MGRRYILWADTSIIVGIVDDDAYILDDADKVAVVIPRDATGVPARGIQAGGHWDVATQTYTQSEQSRLWAIESARIAARPEPVDPEWARQFALHQASQGG